MATALQLKKPHSAIASRILQPQRPIANARAVLLNPAVCARPLGEWADFFEADAGGLLLERRFQINMTREV